MVERKFGTNWSGADFNAINDIAAAIIIHSEKCRYYSINRLAL